MGFFATGDCGLARGLPEEIAATLRRGQGLAVEGKFDEAFELTNRMVEENGITEWYVLNEPAYYAVHAGRYADAVRLYEIAFPQLRDPVRPQVSHANLPDALYFAHALQQLGDSGRASVLFGRILDETEQRRPVGMGNVGITEACVYASLGQADEAVAILRAAVDAGWRGLHETYSGYPAPMLAALEGDTEYQRVIAEIETDLAAQRQRLREKGY